MDTVRMEPHSTAPRSIWKRLGWLVPICASSVAVLGVVAYGFRWIMKLAGLSL